MAKDYFDLCRKVVYSTSMKMTALAILLSLLGAAVAAPLEFYIMPGTGISPYETPMVMPDAQALAAAEQAVEQQKQRCEMGIAHTGDVLDAQLDLLYMQAPLIHGEKSHLLHKGKMFKVARERRRWMEARHKKGLCSDWELYRAQLADAWLRGRQLSSADADVSMAQLKRAGDFLVKLANLVENQKLNGQAGKDDELLVAVAICEVKLAQSWRNPEAREKLRAELLAGYDSLAELMTTRERNGFCETDAAESAREAARIVRRELALRQPEPTPEKVAALEERCEIIAAMIPILPELAKKDRWLRFDADVAPRWLERERQKLDTAREKLQKH